jgi:hypothetical protein
LEATAAVEQLADNPQFAGLNRAAADNERKCHSRVLQIKVHLLKCDGAQLTKRRDLFDETTGRQN